MTDLLGTAEVLRHAEQSWIRHVGRAVRRETLLGELIAGTSLPEAFHQIADAAPDRPALDIGGVAMTHGELDEQAGRIGAWLRVRGVAPGDSVLLAGGTSMAFVTAYLGALRAGAVVVLANPTLTEPELRHLVLDSGATFALTGGTASERLAGACDVVAFDDLEALSADERPLEPPSGDLDDPALLAYTSGTTGTPKAVALTHRNLLSSIRSVMLAWRWRSHDVLVHALPLFHQHGLGGVHATLLAGSRAVIMPRFDAGELCDAIVRHGATVLFGVPAVYERLVGWDGIDRAALGSLRLLTCGSAPLSPALAERVAQRLGSLPLERYGTTESGLNVSNPYDRPGRIGSVGLPLPGVELAIADADGRPLPDGTDGEIVVRGPQVFAGYRGDPEASARSFFPRGWFRTGDIGHIDRADGYLLITGRSKDLIITGGVNVYPREVELALELSPGVERAAVVGVPSDRWGEEVAAAVVPSAGVDLDIGDLLEAVRTRLAPYKCPKRVQVVDALPVNHMGKVVAAEVRRLLTDSAS